MTWVAYLRTAGREARGLGARGAFFVACLAVGVAAVTAVSGVSHGLEAILRSDARQLLAADVAIEGRRPAPSEVDGVLAGYAGLRRSEMRLAATVVAVPGRDDKPGASTLVQLKAVDGSYPFYGEAAVDPERPLYELLRPDTVLVAPELLSRLGTAVGGILRVGGHDFRIVGTVLSEPDRIDAGITLGPRVLVSLAGFDRAGLAGFGSRITYKSLIRLPDGDGARQAADLADAIRGSIRDAGFYEVETYSDAQPGLRNGLRRANQFLGLVALLSLLVGGVGVGQTVRAWMAGRLDAVAVLKVLGMRPREILGLYLGQTLGLALAGGVAGAAAGTAVLAAVPWLLRGLVRTTGFDPWQPWAIARGLGLGVAIAMLFALPALLAVRRVPPLRVIRRDLEPLAPSRRVRAVIWAILTVGVVGAASVQSGSPALGAGFAAGLAAIVAALWFSAWGLARTMGTFPRRFARVTVRHGLAALARPGADTLGSIVALGLGTLVVLAMHLVQGQLERGLRADLPDTLPSVFFADIQPDQWDGLRALLEAEGAAALFSAPVVNARLAAVGGRPVDEIVAEDGPAGSRPRRWALTREQNLTYRAELSDDNTLVAGRWWSDPSQAEVSVEREFAEDLGVGVGDALAFDVQGVRIDTIVANLREVRWNSYRPNFFLIVEPGVLEEAPQLRVAAASLPVGREAALRDLVSARYANVIAIPVREILEKVASVLRRAGQVVRFLGGFTVVAGIVILAGTVAAGSVRRGREVALLKTLGMTRAGVVAVFAVEYALIGCVAGIVGSLGAGVLAWVVVTRGMELEWSLAPWPFAATLVGVVALTVLAGIAASWRALSRPPLRELGGVP